MNKITIAQTAKMNGFKYVRVAGTWVKNKFYFNLEDAERDMSQFFPGTAYVTTISEYLSVFGAS